MSHEISLAVWDLTSPVVIGRRPTLKVGLSCTSGCNLSDTTVDVYDDAGERIGGGTLGAEPWQETVALYWAEVDLVAPEREGDVWLQVRAALALPHADARSVVTFFVSRPPEHRIRLEVIDSGSRLPLGNVELRVGRFRATTNDGGIAVLEVPGGTYDVATWKNGYDVLATTIDVSRDTTIHLELAAARELEQPYWM